MLTYITAFIFYTLAMIGIMFGAFIIYKKTMMPNRNESKSMIKVLDKIAVSPKKSLMVVKVKNEKFLIALDAENTTFLSKLADDKQAIAPQKEEKPIKQQVVNQKTRENYIDDIQQERLDKIQRQFKQLYSSNQEEERNDSVIDRKEMIRKLLKDLNDTTGSIKTGSY